MTIEELAIFKTLCTDSIGAFTRYFFAKNHARKFALGYHHKQIFDVLDQVVDGKIKRLIINVPPRFSKTEIAVKHFISYALARNPKAKFIHLSYSSELALDNSEGVKDIVKSDAYREMFPNVQIKPGTDSKHKWYTSDGGGIYAASSGSSVTGFGAGQVDIEDEDFTIDDAKEFAGAIIIDDPIKPEDCESPILRDKINKRFDSTIRSRVNSRNTPIIIIMQRLHPEDLCGYLLKSEPDVWTVLSLP